MKHIGIPELFASARGGFNPAAMFRQGCKSARSGTRRLSERVRVSVVLRFSNIFDSFRFFSVVAWGLSISVPRWCHQCGPVRGALKTALRLCTFWSLPNMTTVTSWHRPLHSAENQEHPGNKHHQTPSNTRDATLPFCAVLRCTRWDEAGIAD